MRLHAQPRTGRRASRVWRTCTLAALVFAAMGPGGARAQDPPIVVIASTGAETEPNVAARWVRAVSSRLARAGQPVLPPTDAARQFELSESAPAPSVSTAEVDEFVERSRNGLRQLARGERARAIEALREADSWAGVRVTTLNREATVAERVLDNCLYLTRALLESDEDELARVQARRCRILVPRAVPSATRHTPEVRELLGEIEGLVVSQPAARLRVESTPSACAVRLNGVTFGQTPFEADALLPGEYAVQVECPGDAVGRVRHLRLTAGTTRVRVNALFDAHVRTSPVLRLRYATLAEEGRAGGTEAARVGAILGARVIRISTSELETTRLEQIVEGRPVAAVWLPAFGVEPEIPEAAVVDLLGGRFVDHTGATPSPRALAGPGRHRETVDRRGRRNAAIALLSLSVSAYGAAGIWHSRLSLLGDEFQIRASLVDPTSEDDGRQRAQRRFDRSVRRAQITASVAGALGLSAVFTGAGRDGDVTWWGLTGAGLGVGLVGLGIRDFRQRPLCYSGVLASNLEQDRRNVADCVDRGRLETRAFLWTSLAGPLIALPIAQLAADRVGLVEVEITPQSASISLRRSF